MAGIRPSAQAKNVYELFAGKVFRSCPYFIDLKEKMGYAIQIL